MSPMSYGSTYHPLLAKQINQTPVLPLVLRPFQGPTLLMDITGITAVYIYYPPSSQIPTGSSTIPTSTCSPRHQNGPWKVPKGFHVAKPDEQTWSSPYPSSHGAFGIASPQKRFLHSLPVHGLGPSPSNCLSISFFPQYLNEGGPQVSS